MCIRDRPRIAAGKAQFLEKKSAGKYRRDEMDTTKKLLYGLVEKLRGMMGTEKDETLDNPARNFLDDNETSSD